MSQYDPNNPAAQFDPTDPLLAEPPRVSKLAVAALVCSFIFCCPVTSLLGLLLGAGGTVSVATSYGARRGMWMALLAMVVSIASLGGQGLLGNTFYEVFRLFVGLPQDFLASVENGDFTAARQFLTSPLDQNVTDEQLETFRQSLADRYGSCTGWQPLSNSGSGQTVDLSVKLMFTNGTRDASVTIEVVQGSTGTSRGSWPFYITPYISEILIEDPDLGDLVFPPKQ